MLWPVARLAVVLNAPLPVGWVSVFDAARLPTTLGRRLSQQRQLHWQECFDCDPHQKHWLMLIQLLLCVEKE